MILSAIGTSGWESFFRLIEVIFIVVFVLVITYVCTRWIARYQKGINTNKNMRVIETFRVTNNKFIQIVEVGKVYLVIAVCKDTVTMLCQLNEENLKWIPDCDEQTQVGNDSFQQILQKFKDKLPRK